MTSSPELGGLPRLHIITNDEVLHAPSFLGDAASLLRAGGERVALHIRGRTLSGRELWDLTSRVVEVARDSGSLIFVNDRLDVALTCRADGVQLGSGSIGVATVRQIAGSKVRIGASVHDLPSARDAVHEGADFLLAGTLFESRSHPGRSGSGCAWLGNLLPLGLPVIGIGGIGLGQVAEVRSAGADGVAVISGVWSAANPVAEVGRYLNELGE